MTPLKTRLVPRLVLSIALQARRRSRRLCCMRVRVCARAWLLCVPPGFAPPQPVAPVDGQGNSSPQPPPPRSFVRAAAAARLAVSPRGISALQRARGDVRRAGDHKRKDEEGEKDVAPFHPRSNALRAGDQAQSATRDRRSLAHLTTRARDSPSQREVDRRSSSSGPRSEKPHTLRATSKDRQTEPRHRQNDQPHSRVFHPRDASPSREGRERGVSGAAAGHRRRDEETKRRREEETKRRREEEKKRRREEGRGARLASRLLVHTTTPRHDTRGA